MKDLFPIAGTEDTRTILRWLVKMGIHHTKVGREYIIDKWSYEFRMELAYVETLKQQNPLKWADIFRMKCQDERLLQAVFSVHPPNTLKTHIKRNKNQNHFE